MVNADLTNMTEDEVCGELQHKIRIFVVSIAIRRGVTFTIYVKFLGGHS